MYSDRTLRRLLIWKNRAALRLRLRGLGSVPILLCESFRSQSLDKLVDPVNAVAVVVDEIAHDSDQKKRSHAQSSEAQTIESLHLSKLKHLFKLQPVLFPKRDLIFTRFSSEELFQRIAFGVGHDQVDRIRSSFARSLRFARARLDLEVPGSIPSIPAISSCLYPSITCRLKTVLQAGGSS